MRLVVLMLEDALVNLALQTMSAKHQFLLAHREPLKHCRNTSVVNTMNTRLVSAKYAKKAATLGSFATKNGNSSTVLLLKTTGIAHSNAMVEEVAVVQQQMLVLLTPLIVVRLQPMNLMQFNLLVVSAVHLMLMVSVVLRARQQHAVSEQY